MLAVSKISSQGLAAKYKSKMETLRLTKTFILSWKKPEFQREFRETPKIHDLIQELKLTNGAVPGVITLGEVVRSGAKETYLVDGQHRTQAFLQAGLEFGYADVRICQFDNMSEMAEAFVQLNQSLVRMQNDDILRGIEGSNPYLSQIRKACPFLGYDKIRKVRQDHTAKHVLSLTVALRAWFGSATPTPSAGPKTVDAAAMLDDENLEQINDFYGMLFDAWGGDQEHFRLWCGLNIGLLAWLWRRMVLGQFITPVHHSTKITKVQFRSCCMALATDSLYLDWLQGRNMRYSDRSPAYGRIRDIFKKRLVVLEVKGCKFPQPEWVG